MLKQEMLSKGGEAAVADQVVNCRRESTDVILMGTLAQHKVIEKLKIQPAGLPALAAELEELLDYEEAPGGASLLLPVNSFALQQLFLQLQPGAEAAEPAVPGQDAVAGNNEHQGVGPAGIAHSPCRPPACPGSGQFHRSYGIHPTEWPATVSTPPFERVCPGRPGQGKGLPGAGKPLFHLAGSFLQQGTGLFFPVPGAKEAAVRPSASASRARAPRGVST